MKLGMATAPAFTLVFTFILGLLRCALLSQPRDEGQDARHLECAVPAAKSPACMTTIRCASRNTVAFPAAVGARLRSQRREVGVAESGRVLCSSGAQPGRAIDPLESRQGEHPMKVKTNVKAGPVFMKYDGVKGDCRS